MRQALSIDSPCHISIIELRNLSESISIIIFVPVTLAVLICTAPVMAVSCNDYNVFARCQTITRPKLHDRFTSGMSVATNLRWQSEENTSHFSTSNCPHLATVQYIGFLSQVPGFSSVTMLINSWHLILERYILGRNSRVKTGAYNLSRYVFTSRWSRNCMKLCYIHDLFKFKQVLLTISLCFVLLKSIQEWTKMSPLTHLGLRLFLRQVSPMGLKEKQRNSWHIYASLGNLVCF